MSSESDATSEYSVLRWRLWAGRAEGKQRLLFGRERAVSEDEIPCLEQCVISVVLDGTVGRGWIVAAH